MTRLIAVISFALAVQLLAATDLQAQSYPPAPCPAHGARYLPHGHYRLNHDYYRNPYDYYRDLYPKYYYGRIHARHFYNLGYPGGEVHLRGTPW